MFKSESVNLCDDLANWMTNLPELIKKVPIKNLAIPGSHDSFTSSIKSSSPISPDAGELLQRMNCMGPMFRSVIRRWVRTQEFNALTQLQVGIRYFDLRISTKEGTHQLYFVHGLYSDEIDSVLRELIQFLDNHPKELVILDCQHFYEFTLADHRRLISYIKGRFNSKLVPVSSSMDFLTLEYTQKHDYQVIIIYRCNEIGNDKLLWPGWNFPNPWPETTNKSELIKFLDDELKRRNNFTALITQFLLTPTPGSILKRFYSSLKSSCVDPIDQMKYRWLLEQSPKEKLNIVIADFIDMNNSKFPKCVISLNKVYLIGRYPISLKQSVEELTTIEL
ncbi:PI-PLC X domain-containing protein 3 [Onthophagus taurus]|uniref:PI-PLC X domain-containing protein 3 n=1 Tax=Onthophagus taurus TaxID=166361 RepID=UPI0039BE5D4B